MASMAPKKTLTDPAVRLDMPSNMMYIPQALEVELLRIHNRVGKLCKRQSHDALVLVLFSSMARVWRTRPKARQKPEGSGAGTSP